MRCTPPAVIAMLCLLAACQTVPGADPSMTRAGSMPVMATSNAGLLAIPDCAAGVSATLADGLRVGYAGSDPDDPQRCLVEWSDRAHPMYFGFWTPSAKTPMSEEARDALRTVLLGPVGTETSFETERARLWNRVTVTHVGNRVVDVAGKPRPALELRVVRHDAHGRPDVRAETRYVIDRATGVMLQRQSITPMADGNVSTITSWQVGSLDDAG